MAKLKVTDGTTVAAEKVSITVLDKGPYIVNGRPPLSMQFIMPNARRESWYFQQGPTFKMEEPTALCRCGASKKKPYCDGAHVQLEWDPTLGADPHAKMLDHAETVEGEALDLTDGGTPYCAFARFCDPEGDVWTITEERSQEPAAKELAIREASMCPAGRLNAWDKRTGNTWEYQYEPSLGLIEDPVIHASGGLWVRGGIVIKREDGKQYEVKNRAVLCRCGRSDNKPWCNGAHAAKPRWQDELPGEPKGEKQPENP